jgi:hypothetical protein
MRGDVFCGCCVTGTAPTHAAERSWHVGRPLGRPANSILSWRTVHDAALKGSLRRPAAALDRRFSRGRGRKQSASDGAALPAYVDRLFLRRSALPPEAATRRRLLGRTCRGILPYPGDGVLSVLFAIERCRKRHSCPRCSDQSPDPVPLSVLVFERSEIEIARFVTHFVVPFAQQEVGPFLRQTLPLDPAFWAT